MHTTPNTPKATQCTACMLRRKEKPKDGKPQHTCCNENNIVTYRKILEDIGITACSLGMTREDFDAKVASSHQQGGSW